MEMEYYGWVDLIHGFEQVLSTSGSDEQLVRYKRNGGIEHVLEKMDGSGYKRL